MALEPIINKRRKAEMKAGTYLATISDMYIHKNAEKKPIMIDGFVAIIVQFVNKEKQIHEQMYVMDGDFKQKYFLNMLRSAQVPLESGKQPTRNDCINKKLWVSIQDVHYINDDVVVMDINNEPQIDYHIFKVYPVIDGMKSPQIKGDPINNNGIPGDQFITYKNISVNEKESGLKFVHEESGPFPYLKKIKEDLGDVPQF